MTGIICAYANENGYCDSTACHNMNIVGNFIPKERPENISNSSIWVKPNSDWHPGTPTEKGWYILAYRYGSEDAKIEYIALEWDGVWKDTKVGWDALKVFDLGWQKFNEYKES